MRPGFNYLDKIDEKFKAANKRIHDVEQQEEKKKVESQAQTVQVSEWWEGSGKGWQWY